jgi:hypothetical protein
VSDYAKLFICGLVFTDADRATGHISSPRPLKPYIPHETHIEIIAIISTYI